MTASNRKFGIIVRILLFSSALLLAFLLAWRINLSWKYDYHINHVSGTWAALASDASHGTWYRPLYCSELGYGGTRYFPLHFVLHSFLMRWGGPIAMGHLLDFSAFLLLLLSVYTFLTRFEVPRVYAAALALLIPATKGGQFAALSVRGDVLPSMLNVWGLVVCAAAASQWWGIPLAAAFFSLAFAAKPTAVYGAVAVCVSWYFGGQRRSAFKLMFATGVGFLVVLGTMYVASQGRAFGVLRAVALEGDPIWKVLKGPASLVATAFIGDPASLGFLLVGAAVFLTLPRERRWEIPTVYFVLATMAVAIIVATPGSTWNHLVEVQIALICFVGPWLFREREDAAARLGAAALAMAASIAVIPAVLDLRHERSMPKRSKYDEVLKAVSGVGQPVLWEDPMPAVLAGQRPYLVDAFTIQAVGQRDPSFADPIKSMINNQQFGAVVLVVDPRTLEGKDWYESQQFGGWFVETLDRNYEFKEMRGLFVFIPRKR